MVNGKVRCDPDDPRSGLLRDACSQRKEALASASAAASSAAVRSPVIRNAARNAARSSSGNSPSNARGSVTSIPQIRLGALLVYLLQKKWSTQYPCRAVKQHAGDGVGAPGTCIRPLKRTEVTFGISGPRLEVENAAFPAVAAEAAPPAAAIAW